MDNPADTSKIDKVWARCACVGANGTTLDFYFGIHEYGG